MLATTSRCFKLGFFFALVGLSRFHSAVAQNTRSHAAYACQSPGQRSLRTNAALDYALCKRKHETYCLDCRCQFTAYLESAQSCMEIDEEYRIRVEETIAEWREHMLEYCPIPGFNRETSALPVYSLSVYDSNYCGEGSAVQLSQWTAMLALLLLLALL